MSNIQRVYEKNVNADKIFAEYRQCLDDSLLLLCEALEKHGVRYSFDSGTLLGAYRNGESLSKDSDHDITIAIEELMLPHGRAFLKEYSANLHRSVSHSRTFDIKTKSVEVFTNADIILERIEAGEPFFVSNLGWEALYDGKPHVADYFKKRRPLKIDLFILYPWNSILRGNEIFPDAKDHHVYSLPFNNDKFYRIKTEQIVGDLEDVESTLDTFNGPIKRAFPGYVSNEDYILSTFGENWRIPHKNYAWHGATNWLPTKIRARDVMNAEISDSVIVQNTFKFDPKTVDLDNWKKLNH